MKINISWFRRDLRLEDNTALREALNSGSPVLPLFIFDTNIINELPADDPRISFIYETLSSMNKVLQKEGSSFYIVKGDPEKVWRDLIASFDINSVFINKDYEPYGIERDAKIESLLKKNHINFLKFKDHVIFEEKEILKTDKNPYTIFTPYKNKWLQKFSSDLPLFTIDQKNKSHNYLSYASNFPTITELGFRNALVKVRSYDLSVIADYNNWRDIPAADKTSYLSPHLRFGTVSIRKLVKIAFRENPVFLSELIWREFFMQVLFHFPNVVIDNFRPVYNGIHWRNDEKDFERWCNGETGYPFVDAGMRQLNKSGYMHNRVRMITAGFLCKQLLIDWRWGEAYFAQKLLDYELSSNNGNWQWAAGTGCDAAPYFRVFNPGTQQMKFDPAKEYIMKWVEDIDKSSYPKPVIDHDFARQRAITAFQTGLKKRLNKTSFS